MKRMLKYMAVYAQRISLFFLIFLAIWSLYLTVVTGDFSISGYIKVLNQMPLFAMTLGGLVEMICTMGYVPLLINAQLSMGATRKEIWAGVFWGHGLIAVEITIITVILKLIWPGVIAIPINQFAAASLAITLTVAAVGSLIGLLVDRFGRVAYYIAVGVLALTGGLIGGTSVAFINGAGIDLTIGTIIYAISVGAVVAFVIIAFVFRALTAKKEVRV